MNIRTAPGKADIDVIHQPLAELLKRAQRSKPISGADESGESEAFRAAYARLGKLVGR